MRLALDAQVPFPPAPSITTAHPPQTEHHQQQRQRQAWQDWRACLYPPGKKTKGADHPPTYEELAKTFPPRHDTAFHAFLQSAPRTALPWDDAAAASVDGAGVLITPGIPEKRVLWRSLQNAVDNLPAAWPIWVAGGASALALVRELFPVEVEVGKVTLEDLGDEALDEVSRRERHGWWWSWWSWDGGDFFLLFGWTHAR